MKICHCNLCCLNYTDPNPSKQSIDYPEDKPVAGELIMLYEEEGKPETGFWGCPTCKDDGHLQDNYMVFDLSKVVPIIDINREESTHNSNPIDIGNLSPAQTKILALLAYECLSQYQYPDESKYSYKIDTAQHACAILNVPEDLIWAVRHGKIKGIQNLNRLEIFDTYSNNYEFKL